MNHVYENVFRAFQVVAQHSLPYTIKVALKISSQ